MGQVDRGHRRDRGSIGEDQAQSRARAASRPSPARAASSHSRRTSASRARRTDDEGRRRRQSEEPLAALLVGIGDDKDAEKIAWRHGHARRLRCARAKERGSRAPRSHPGVRPRRCPGARSREPTDTPSTRATRLRRRPSPPPSFLGAPKGARGLTAAVRAGKAVAESANFARDLVNRPPNDLNPVTLARAAASRVTKLGLVVPSLEQGAHRKRGHEPAARGQQGQRDRAPGHPRGLQARAPKEEGRFRRARASPSMRAVFASSRRARWST